MKCSMDVLVSFLLRDLRNDESPGGAIDVVAIVAGGYKDTNLWHQLWRLSLCWLGFWA